MAHEIRTPLTEILGHVYFYKREQHPESLDKITRAVEKIEKIIHSLKKLSREPHALQFSPVNLYPFLVQLSHVFQNKFQQETILFKINNNTSSDLVNIHETLFGQVILNLLHNSYEAIAQQPANKWINIDLAQKDSYLSIAVTDSGPGIPPELRSKIMGPFYSTKERNGGTGLGLSTSLRIMDVHKGKLYLNPDSPNTQFVILLPINRENYTKN